MLEVVKVCAFDNRPSWLAPIYPVGAILFIAKLDQGVFSHRTTPDNVASLVYADVVNIANYSGHCYAHTYLVA